MTTIINTPPSGENSDSGLSLVVGVVIAIGLIVLFIVYGLPALRQNNNEPTTTNTTIIAPGLPGATGATGATGNTGATGETGATGATGGLKL